MLDRRLFSAALGGAAIFPALFPTLARAQSTLPFYSSTGPKLTRYVLDATAATVTPVQTVTLPSNVQYAWPDPKRRFLYVAASNNIPGGLSPEVGGHFVQAFRVGGDGALTAHGPLVAGETAGACHGRSQRALFPGRLQSSQQRQRPSHQ